MKKKLATGLVTGLFVLGLTGMACAYTFQDNFNDQGLQGNWMAVVGDWSYGQPPSATPGDGNYAYVGRKLTNDVAISKFNNISLFDNAGLNLSVFTLLGVGDYNSFSGIFFSTQHLNFPNGYAAGITKQYNGAVGKSNYYLTAGVIGSSMPAIPIAGGASLNSNSVFRINIDTSNNSFVTNIYDKSDLSTSIGELTTDMTLPFNSGMVGLYAGSVGGFDNFSVTGNPVPVPGAVWLLGSGLAGITAIRKRKRQTA